MTKLKMIPVGLMILGLLGCATIWIAPKPLDSQSSAVGISFRSERTFGMSIFDMVCFVQLKDTVDTFMQEEVWMSNYMIGNQYFLLNVPLGRYAAVMGISVVEKVTSDQDIIGAGNFSVGIATVAQNQNPTYFPTELIAQTEVTVGPGEIAFMGDYVIKTSMGVKDADEVQQHYHRIVAPDLAEEPKAARAAEVILGTLMRTGVRYFYLPTVLEAHRSKESEITFLTDAKNSNQLKQKGWIKIIDDRLAELQSEQTE